MQPMADLGSNAASDLKQGEYRYNPKLVWNSEVKEYLNEAYGERQFADICLALTRPCITSTIRVNTHQTTTQDVIEQLCHHFRGTAASKLAGTGCPNMNRTARMFTVEKSLSSSERRATEEGTKPDNGWDEKVDGHNCSIVAKGREDVSDQQISDSCWEHPFLKDVVMVRGRGPCEVDCCDGRDEPLVKEVIVSRKCGEAVLRGANVFVPGLLACSLHVEEGDEVAVTVATERLDSNGGWYVGITRGTTLASEHAKSQLKGTMHGDYFIGKGRVKMSRAALFKETRGTAIVMTDRVFDLPPFHGLLTGHIFLQNLPSIVAARVLEPKPGERILDMCAAPGGKTTAMAILMEDRGEIVALDRSHQKVLEIKLLCQEMGLTCILPYKMDATKASKKTDDVSEMIEMRSHPLKRADNIRESSQLAPELNAAARAQVDVHHRSLLDNDACSSKYGAYANQTAARKEARKMKNMAKRGQTRETSQRWKGFKQQSFDRVLLDAPCSALGLRPRLFAGEVTLECLRSHACYQRKLLDQAVRLVRPGGTLVYSTCTMNPGENEGVVRYALDTYDFLSLVSQEPKLGGPGLVGGLNVYDGMGYKEWLREEEKDLVQRFNPAGMLDTIGFFIAKFAVNSKAGQFDSPSDPSALEH